MCHEDGFYPLSGGEHLQEQNLTIQVEGGSLPLVIVMPERTPAPAVLIVHDIYGAGPFYQDLARRLADAGYIAALPDFFFRQGPAPEDKQAARERGSRVVQSQALGDTQAALTWLKGHDSGNGQAGTIGMCWGGTMVMLAASREPVPDASVIYYGFPVREPTPEAPIIPIDDDEIAAIDSPLLGFWGEQDQGVGMDNVAAYDDKLDQSGMPHEFIMYPDVGHGFLTFDPSDDAYAASVDAWNRTLAFLGEHLGEASGI